MDYGVGYGEGQPFEQPPRPPFEIGGGGGGRAAYRPAQRTWALPEHVGAFRSAQVFSRMWKSMVALGAVGSAVAPVMDFSQANWPGYQNDIGWQPPDYLKDMEIHRKGWDALIVPEDDDYIAPTRYVQPASPEYSRVERQFRQRDGGVITAPDGSRIISRGDEAKLPQTPDQMPQEVATSAKLDAALAAYEERIAQLNANASQWKDRNARMVQEELARREYEDAVARINADAGPARGVSIVVRPGLPIHVKLRYQELQDERVNTRRRADNKVPPFYAAIQRVITATLGRGSEVQDAIDALAWNMYSLDGRGRPVQAMLKYNSNTGYVLREWRLGRARLDMWGFAVDYAVQQWSDAAYAFQAREQDMLALRLGWKAPVGVTATYRNMMRETPGWENDVSSSWVRSQSRFFRSQDVWRSQRVQSLWRKPVRRSSGVYVPASYGLQSSA